MPQDKATLDPPQFSPHQKLLWDRINRAFQSGVESAEKTGDFGFALKLATLKVEFNRAMHGGD